METQQFASETVSNGVKQRIRCFAANNYDRSRSSEKTSSVLQLFVCKKLSVG